MVRAHACLTYFGPSEIAETEKLSVWRTLQELDGRERTRAQVSIHIILLRRFHAQRVASITWKDITFLDVPFPVRLSFVLPTVSYLAVDLCHAKVSACPTCAPPLLTISTQLLGPGSASSFLARALTKQCWLAFKFAARPAAQYLEHEQHAHPGLSLPGLHRHHPRVRLSSRCCL